MTKVEDKLDDNKMLKQDKVLYIATTKVKEKIR
jgi:hypothetical protein